MKKNFLLLFACFSVYSQSETYVSLDFCSDYYLHQMVESKNILALSPQITNPHFSHLFIDDSILSHQNNLERIIRLNPEHILAGSFAYGNLAQSLEKKGFSVHYIPSASTIEQIKQNNTAMGELLHNPQKAKQMNKRLDQAMEQKPPKKDQTAILLSAGGFAAHQGSHYDLLLDFLGFEHHYPNKKGFAHLSKEELALNPADHLIYIQAIGSKQSQLGDFHTSFNEDTLKIPLSYMACANDQLVDAAQYLKGKFK